MARVDFRSDTDDAELVAIERGSFLRKIAAERRVVDVDDRKIGELPRKIVRVDDAMRRAVAVRRRASRYGSLHGGIALALMSKAAFVAATRRCRKPVVMAASRNVAFIEQVSVGKIVEAVPMLIATGTSSLTVEVERWAERLRPPHRKRCGQATFVMVALGADGRPTSVANGHEFPP